MLPINQKSQSCDSIKRARCQLRRRLAALAERHVCPAFLLNIRISESKSAFVNLLHSCKNSAMTQSVPHTLRERRKAETWTALHESAASLALERGIDEATIDAIAESAGVSSRTFFNYFRAK